MNYRTVKLRILRMAPKTGKTEVTRRSGSNLKAGKLGPLHCTRGLQPLQGLGPSSPTREQGCMSGSRGFRYAQLILRIVGSHSRPR